MTLFESKSIHHTHTSNSNKTRRDLSVKPLTRTSPVALMITGLILIVPFEIHLFSPGQRLICIRFKGCGMVLRPIRHNLK
jgi:hypothetical protein